MLLLREFFKQQYLKLHLTLILQFHVCGWRSNRYVYLFVFMFQLVNLGIPSGCPFWATFCPIWSKSRSVQRCLPNMVVFSHSYFVFDGTSRSSNGRCMVTSRQHGAFMSQNHLKHLDSCYWESWMLYRGLFVRLFVFPSISELFDRSYVVQQVMCFASRWSSMRASSTSLSQLDTAHTQCLDSLMDALFLSPRTIPVKTLLDEIFSQVHYLSIIIFFHLCITGGSISTRSR